MIRVTGRGIAADDQATHYSLAGQAMVCQNSMQDLDAFATGLATRSFTNLLSKFIEPSLMTAANAKLRYFGKAYFDKEFREVRYWRSGKRGQIDIQGVPECLIDFDEAHIHLLNCEPLGKGLNLELITGPALVLLLAQQHTYCMHAGSIDTEAGRIGIIAESGAGKSTLSAHVDDKWSQVTDDIMPLMINEANNHVDLLPDFPQLKLANNVVVDSPKASGQLDFLLRVNPEPSKKIRFKVLPRTHAMLQIVRHTVAAKLFDTYTLREHAGFAKKVSTLVPVVEISYPREFRQLSELQNKIVDYLKKFDR